MDKSITFVDKDAQLIKKIVAYQKERGISSFVETVRQLCEKALKFSEITKQGWNKDEKDYCIGVMRSYAFVVLCLR